MRTWFKLAVAWCRRQLTAAYWQSVSLRAKCPWCGHFGARLKHVPPGTFMEKDEPGVLRICETCGGPAWEPTVLKKDAWLVDAKGEIVQRAMAEHRKRAEEAEEKAAKKSA